MPAGVVLADAGYGNDTDFRFGISTLRLTYAVGIQSSTTVWSAGHEPLPPRGNWGRGRPGTRWRRIQWREDECGTLASRFARVRVSAAPRDHVHPEEWLVIEWPLAESEPTKYWLSTLPESCSFKELVRLIKLRWRIERDYQELKQEVGLGHYEGRNW